LGEPAFWQTKRKKSWAKKCGATWRWPQGSAERGVDDDEAPGQREGVWNVELVREVTRDAWGWGFLDRLMQTCDLACE